jgi:hypothetical protein
VSVLAALAEASAGLVYSSESDRPFEPVVVADPDSARPLDESYLRQLLHVPAETRCELRSIDQVLARHTHLTDPYDVATQQLRPRYERLQALMEQRLSGAVACRVGAIEVRVWLLGRGPDGLVGVVTTAIET